MLCGPAPREVRFEPWTHAAHASRDLPVKSLSQQSCLHRQTRQTQSIHRVETCVVAGAGVAEGTIQQLGGWVLEAQQSRQAWLEVTILHRPLRLESSLLSASTSHELYKQALHLRCLLRLALSANSLMQEHSLNALRRAVESFERPVFPCALIAGDVVILDLLSRLGCLADGRVRVIFIDTFHLFDETYSFLHSLEEKYGFTSLEFHAKGFANKEEYRQTHGSDLFLVDIDKYDGICKVEPFNRSLVETKADVMINGRRQDHGFERAHIEVFEEGKPVKCNPLAWWTFKDCFDYLKRRNLQYHPLHDKGFPSVGDVQSTIPVPKEKWFEYAGERSGRFQGMTNADGSAKTECGIHVAGEDGDTGLSNLRR